MGQTTNLSAPARRDLPRAVLVGFTTAAASTGQVAQEVPEGQTPITRLELAEKIIADALPVRFHCRCTNLSGRPIKEEFDSPTTRKH